MKLEPTLPQLAPKLDPAPQPNRQLKPPEPQPAPQVAPKMNRGAEPAPNLVPQPSPIAAPRMQPVAIPQAALKAVGRLQLTPEETLSRLEPVIQGELAKIKAVLDSEGIKPEDVTFVFELDITGEAKVRCTFCGRPGCGYKPAAYADKNLELDLLESGLVVFLEVARRLGSSYGAVVYDDTNVLVLREVDAAGAGDGAIDLMTHYRAFRDRKEYPDSKSRAWLDKMLAKWVPKMATQKVVGKALDLQALDVGGQLLDYATGKGPRGLNVAKSSAPKDSLKASETLLRRRGIDVVGTAVGADAANVAAEMFKDTDVAHNPHMLRERIGDRMIAIIDASVERNG